LRIPIVAMILALTSCDRSPQEIFGGSQTVRATALRGAGADTQVTQFYQLRGGKVAWTNDARKQLRDALADAVRHALDPSDFPMADKGSDTAAREVALTKSALRYAHALANGVVDPKKLWDIYTVPGNRVDLVRGLNGAIEAGNVKGWLASLAPSDPEYQALSAAYLQYRQRGAQTPRIEVAPGRVIKPGMRDPRVPTIISALRIQGYFGSAPEAAPAQGKAGAADPTRYTRATAAAVSLLQADYGIKADGIISDDTLEAINTGLKDRARILAVNLERRRWLQRQPPATRIDVNTAATFLEYWRDGARVDARRVVVGQPDWETPQIGSPLRNLVANPPWRVPDKIAEKEILPKGSGYMARNDMHFEENGRIVQAGGPKSALGLVKLDLDNPYAIYLHDTPAKAFFAQEERHASHGCVRVQNAVDFARMIAMDENALADFDKGLGSGKETTVDLPRPIPVRLLYHSAYLEKGRIIFRPDPYGWDDRLAKALGLGMQVRQRVKPLEPTDLGP
jgi:murein L,D-transpeptidase YcbB/YkuD